MITFRAKSDLGKSLGHIPPSQTIDTVELMVNVVGSLINGTMFINL